MGSTISKLSDRYNSKNIFGEDQISPIYMQFVPGLVVSVVTSKETSTYAGNTRNINSILAFPHVGSDLKIKSNPTEKNRYFPLFRGWVDTPVEGDQVLLCTMGGVQYYIGPVNTTNLADWNVDHLNLSDITRSEVISKKSRDTSELLGLSKNFISTRTNRLEKMYNQPLDDPDGNKPVYNQIHGDMVFEGRHGNSIRIGSRNINPYIIISNGRNYNNPIEGLVDGSIFAIFERGTIRQHFINDKKLDEEGKKKIDNPYILSSDKPELENKRLMSDLIAILNDESIDPEQKIYAYGNEDNQNQIMISSDRIILDSKHEDIYLSSFGDIHIGAGGNMTISTNRELYIEASNIYLGKEGKLADNENKQPMVLGKTLIEILNELIDAIGELYVGGIPSTNVSFPVAQTTPPSPGWIKIEQLKNKMKTMLSEYHFIENNGQKA